MVVSLHLLLFVNLPQLILFHPLHNFQPLFLLFLILGFLPHFVQLHQIIGDMPVDILKLQLFLFLDSTMFLDHLPELLAFSAMATLMTAPFRSPFFCLSFLALLVDSFHPLFFDIYLFNFFFNFFQLPFQPTLMRLFYDPHSLDLIVIVLMFWKSLFLFAGQRVSIFVWHNFVTVKTIELHLFLRSSGQFLLAIFILFTVLLEFIKLLRFWLLRVSIEDSWLTMREVRVSFLGLRYVC